MDQKRKRMGLKMAMILFILGMAALASVIINTPAVAGSAVKFFDTSGAPRGIHMWDGGFQGVIVSDQTTRPFDFTFSQTSNTDMTLSESPIAFGYDIDVTAGHSLVAGDSLSILEITSEQPDRYYTGTVISIDGNTATMDTPICYAFDPLLSVMYERTNNLAVNGAITTYIFSLTNAFPDAVDLTRLIIHLLSDSPMDDALFGSLPALSRGIVFRKKISDTEYINYWNVKSNGGFGLLGYDTKYNDKAPSGEYGLSSRISYSGMDKHGVAIRVFPGETVEILVQDDLTDLSDFKVMAQGHFTSVEYE